MFQTVYILASLLSSHLPNCPVSQHTVKLFCSFAKNNILCFLHSLTVMVLWENLSPSLPLAANFTNLFPSTQVRHLACTRHIRKYLRLLKSNKSPAKYCPFQYPHTLQSTTTPQTQQLWGSILTLETALPCISYARDVTLLFLKTIVLSHSQYF